ncbi:hypothetical protein QWY93_12660 [Echinicola jeungdonensis]|uniref:Uncharacterized protein n=1 Tax=Echinicola jeungdonensis TaxID=709343 RepID=A0ABV5J916_9BACT|nr:hypothetical protein [Echinicola jeungdonensis]MDN3670176.1 hypothetical protein [Echinicola jeungdonensis]
MKHKLILTLLAIFFLNNIEIVAQKYEVDYADLIQKELGGQREVAVTSGYVDILTEEFAIEVDFAPKWKEAIGQALWYGLQTNKSPGIVLIKKEEKDQKYPIQLETALQYGNLDQKIKVWVWPDDFNVNEPQKTNNDEDTNYWLTTDTNIRHNSGCRYFKKTEGEFCSEEEGVACQICGG